MLGYYKELGVSSGTSIADRTLKAVAHASAG